MTWRPLTPRTHLALGRSHSFAGQKARLLHPSGELSFVELVVLMDVEEPVGWVEPLRNPSPWPQGKVMGFARAQPILRPVISIDRHILLGEIAGEHPVAALAE